MPTTPTLPDSDASYVCRNHRTAALVSGALFSHNGEHRYALWRIWGDGPFVTFCGLNPSIADDERSDPTCTREVNWARSWGFDGFVKVNWGSYRSTERAVLKKIPIETATGGLYNDIALVHYARAAALVVVCWGVDGALFGRGREIYQQLRAWSVEPYAFHFYRDGKRYAEVANGEPRHTLYLPNSAKLHAYSR
jgi:hypothetical protein